METKHEDSAVVRASHFIELARQGGSRFASGGERRSRQLLLAILECAPGLDDTALAGAADFLMYAAANPNAARELVGVR